MPKRIAGYSGPSILFASFLLCVGCTGDTQVELAKTTEKFELPKEGKKREDLPKSLRPPAKGTTYGINHDPSKGAGAGGGAPP